MLGLCRRTGRIHWVPLLAVHAGAGLDQDPFSVRSFLIFRSAACTRRCSGGFVAPERLFIARSQFLWPRTRPSLRHVWGTTAVARRRIWEPYSTETEFDLRRCRERATGIEPAFSAWEAHQRTVHDLRKSGEDTTGTDHVTGTINRAAPRNG
jgi:hypothetical protein